MTTYSFCEPAWATSTSRWHIRKLTEQGKKLGGGIDTASLCGRVGPPEHGNGWDLEVFDESHFHHCCQECVRLFKKG